MQVTETQLNRLADLIASAARRVGPAGRFGNRKVFLSAMRAELPAALQSQYPTVQAMGPVLQALASTGRIQLARADLVGAMDPALVAASCYAQPLGFGMVAESHFVWDSAPEAAEPYERGPRR